MPWSISKRINEPGGKFFIFYLQRQVLERETYPLARGIDCSRVTVMIGLALGPDRGSSSLPPSLPAQMVTDRGNYNLNHLGCEQGS